ncbi:MAG: Trm112 family protein [Planctomycetota bacterium]
MMFDPEFLQMLVCPASKQALREATTDELSEINAEIVLGAIRNRGGEAVTEAIPAGLATVDGAWLYPVRDAIPILLSPEAIALGAGDRGAGDRGAGDRGAGDRDAGGPKTGPDPGR